MELEPAAAPRIDIGKLPYFNGFPYLATRLASAVYHIRLLPAEWSRDAQWDFALCQAGGSGTSTIGSGCGSPRRAEVPAGLARCEACGEWQSECLDPGPHEIPWFVRVHCRCENKNHCAGCGG